MEIFQEQTRQMAESRYRALRDRREERVDAEPALKWIFEFLETH